MQCEPEFARLKLDLEVAKERAMLQEDRVGWSFSRAQLERADAAVKKQKEVESNFLEYTEKLQATYEKKKQTEADIPCRKQEMKGLHGTWIETVDLF